MLYLLLGIFLFIGIGYYLYFYKNRTIALELIEDNTEISANSIYTDDENNTETNIIDIHSHVIRKRNTNTNNNVDEVINGINMDSIFDRYINDQDISDEQREKIQKISQFIKPLTTNLLSFGQQGMQLLNVINETDNNDNNNYILQIDNSNNDIDDELSMLRDDVNVDDELEVLRNDVNVDDELEVLRDDIKVD